MENNVGNVQETDTRHTYFYDQTGKETDTFQQVLGPIFNSFPRIAGQTTKGTYEFGEIKHIKLCEILIPIRGFEYEFNSHESVHMKVIDDGGKVATLLFKMLDETIDTIIFDQDIEKWTFNENGQVVSKNE